MELKGKAFPKINIGLYVSKKRPDGFHNIISIFQLVEDSFYDSISIHIIEDSKASISVSGLDSVTSGADNSVLKAASLYIDNASISDSFFISVDKNIPSLAGLGGGSSDAGCVLNLLNGYYHAYSQEQLESLALQIGSDVPFFVCGSKTAVAEGRGEVLTPIESRSDIAFKLIPSGQSKKGTGFAYGELDKREFISDLPSKEDLIKMFYSPVNSWSFSNDFSCLYRPVDNAYLTGSGSWFFSVIDLNDSII